MDSISNEDREILTNVLHCLYAVTDDRDDEEYARYLVEAAAEITTAHFIIRSTSVRCLLDTCMRYLKEDRSDEAGRRVWAFLDASRAVA